MRVSVGGMRETGPIQLVPMTPEFLEALLADRREESEQELGISLFADYPDEDERRFLALRLRQMHQDARFQTWSEHAFVLRGQMVGHGGYDGPPGNNAAQAPDAVEFGYARRRCDDMRLSAREPLQGRCGTRLPRRPRVAPPST